MLDKAIVGGKVVTGSSVIKQNIGIKGEKIVQIVDSSTPLNAKETIDAEDKIIIPGAIDPHGHFAMFNAYAAMPFENTFESLAQGAAYGGITTILIHLWGSVGMSMPDTIQQTIKEGEQASVVDFSFHCGVRASGDHIAGIPDAIRMGVPSFKFQMTYHKTGPTGRSVDDYHMIWAMDLIAANNGIALIHAENGSIIDYLEEKYAKEGKLTPEYFLPTRPNIVEAEAIHRASVIANITKCSLYIVHISTKEGIDEVMNARFKGIPISAETCPHYLILTNESLVREGSKFKCGPPLRSEADAETLWQAIRMGIIQYIGSDDAQHTLKEREKEREENNILRASFGLDGIETMLPLMYSEGVAKGRISLTQMVQVLCENTAKAMGIYPRKGTIAIGSDADLVIIDPDIRWTIRAKDLHLKSGYSVYEGMDVVGKPTTSLLRGQVLLKDGSLQQQRGCGKFIAGKLD